MNAPIKLVILDRDGVINFDSDHFIKSPAEWKPIPGSIEAIARLNQNGYRVVVATNQSGIGRGLFDMATLNAINDKMMELVFRQGGRIDAVFFCPCTAEQNCHCRKPDTGMFEDIAARAQRIFPFLRDVRVNRAWSALRVMSPDTFPIYTQSRAHPGAFGVTCHSGVTLTAVHALVLGPALAAGALPPAASPFAADRFDVRAAA